MDSAFFYQLTLHQGAGSGQTEATWVSTLPLLQGNANQVAVLYKSGGTQTQGMYVWTGTQWRFVLPYTEVSYAVIIGATIDIFYNVTVPYTGLPTNTVLWRNGIQGSGTTVEPGASSVWAAVTPPAHGILTVNGMMPDANGNVQITTQGTGTVQSVGLSLPISIFAVTGSPVTSMGTLTATLQSQNANAFFAGPMSGAPGIPAFRTIQSSDLPLATTTTPGVVTVGDGLTVNAGVLAADVWSFNGRLGAITLELTDVTNVGGAPLANPVFTGIPQAPTAAPGTNSEQIATTSFVETAISGIVGVTSFDGRTGIVTLQLSDIVGAGGAPSMSPAFTGVPTAPTATAGTNSTQIATTAFVETAISTISSGVTSFDGRTGIVTLQLMDVTGVGGAPIASPAFTGIPTAPTPTAGDNSTQIATTAFVDDNFVATSMLGAPNGVATLDGTGTIPMSQLPSSVTGGLNYQGTWNAMTNTPMLQSGVGTKGFYYVVSVAGNTLLDGINVWNVGDWAVYSGTAWDRLAGSSGDVLSVNGMTGVVTITAAEVGALTATNNLSDLTNTAAALANIGAAPRVNAALLGTPTAPTATVGTNTTQIATTAFVAAAISSVSGVTSFDGRTGVVTLMASDVTSVGGALLASPAFTGIPTGPTATAGTNTTQLATTAFVAAAVANITGAGVTSFDGRTGIVTLELGDITGAGGAPINNPAFTGIPTAPTATVGTNTQQIATTAFVEAALSTMVSGVTSFDGRTGAVTLELSDITGAGGAPLASPMFTGTPEAPTATAGTNTQQIATTAFVETAVAGYAPTASPTFTGRVQADAYSYTVEPLGSVTGTVTLNLGIASEFTLTITGATTIAFTNTLAASRSEVVYIRFTNAGSAAITWPTGTLFAGGMAPMFTTAGTDLVGVKYDTTTSTYMVFVIGLALAT